MSQEPQKINVVVSGGSTSQVVSPGTSTINLSQGTSTVNVSQPSAASSTVSSTPQANINVGYLGVQGVPGSAINAPGFNGSILYNRHGYISGARNFFYDPEQNKIRISGDSLLMDSGSFILSGNDLNSNSFLLKHGSRDILKVDGENKKIVLAETPSSDEYYVGIGIQDPIEKLHVSGNVKAEGTGIFEDLSVENNAKLGGLTVAGDTYVSGNIVPLVSGAYNLGSDEMPFRDLYLQGDSIVFVDKEAKITASSTGFAFSIIENGVTSTLFEARTDNVGVFIGDGTQLTGVPYTGILDGGVYTEIDLVEGDESKVVPYGYTLNYDPKVMCEVQPPAGSTNMYLTNVTNITRTNCKAEFSAKITGDGNKVICWASPNYAGGPEAHGTE